MDPQDLVRVMTVNSPTEAELVRGALQSVGIACEIGGEGQGGFTGVFEIDILVHASDESSARKHLRKLRHERVERKKKLLAAKRARDAGVPPTDAIQEMPPGQEPRSGD
jgi:hypothetical protein